MAAIAKNLPPRANQTGLLNLRDTRERLKAQIRREGTTSTYSKLKQELHGKDFRQEHMIVHLFGELLYETDGIKGITVCDDSFAFGCYHSFFGKAIAKQGLDKLKELDHECMERYGPLGLGCPHGIGHGLGEYLGPTKLIDQLEACATLSWQGLLFGCQGGVFMEYNFPVVVDQQNARATTRLYDRNAPYAPCPTIPTRFRRACYLELTAWWQDVLHGDYEAIGALCAGLTNEGERQDCFRGIGYSAAQKLSYTIDETQTACRQVPTTEAEALCRAGAAWSFFANPEYRDQAPKLCEGLSTVFVKLCREKSDLLGTGTPI